MNGSDVRSAERDLRHSTQHFEHAMDELEDTIERKTRGLRRAYFNIGRGKRKVRELASRARTGLPPYYVRARDSLRENPTPFVLSALTILAGGIIWALSRREPDVIEVDTLEGLNEPLSSEE